MLRSMGLFEGLTETQLQAVAGELVRREVAAGTVIFEEDGLDDSLYILARGSVDVVKRLGFAFGEGGEAARKTLIRLDAPQFFGEIGLLTDFERSAAVSAHGDCVLLELSRERFEQLVDSDLQLGYRFLRNITVILAFRLRRTDRDVVKLTAALTLALGNR